LIALIINAHPKMSPMLSLSKSMLAQ